MNGHRRTVSARLDAWAAEPSTIVLAIGVASGHEDVDERLDVMLDGIPITVSELDAGHGSRLHVIDVPHQGSISVDYQATLDRAVPQRPPSDAERIRYLRPSRYCESDAVEPFARANFGRLGPSDAVRAVREWVFHEVAYVSGASKPTDGAVSTLLSRQGVCRDFAHLTTALLRAVDVPARMVSVYAPGLSPMDFHAVTEVLLDGQWYVIDSTGLAPRTAMVRIATGADAADIAFFTNIGGHVDFQGLTIMAVSDDGLPQDDQDLLTTLL